MRSGAELGRWLVWGGRSGAWVCGRGCVGGGVWRAGVVGVWRAGVCGGRAGVWVCGGRGGWGCGGRLGVWRPGSEPGVPAVPGVEAGAGTRPAAERLASDVDCASASAGRCTRRSRPPARTTTRVLRSSSPAADAVAWSWTGTLRVTPDRSAVRPNRRCDAAARVVDGAVRIAVPGAGHSSWPLRLWVSCASPIRVGAARAEGAGEQSL